MLPSTGVDDAIDASVYHMPDGNWKMWYKKNANTYSATSKNLITWAGTGNNEVHDCGHEAPVVFNWKGYYWMLVDPCSLSYSGLRIYRSEDGTKWEPNNDLLNTVGVREDDLDQGRHSDVVVIDDRAYIIYFTHPGRIYDEKGVEKYENSWAYRRSSLQIAELELKDGKIFCNRDKYAR